MRALDLPQAEQPAFLRNACGDDLELLRDVESLLEFDSQDEEDDFGVIATDASPLTGGRNQLQARFGIVARLCVAGLLMLAALALAQVSRNAIRRQVRDDLTTLCEVHVRAISAWEGSRIREAEQLARNDDIRSLAQKLVQVAANNQDANTGLRESQSLRQFFELAATYEDSHEGASLHLVSRDGVVLADNNSDLVGCRTNSEAFKYLVPAFAGGATVTPLVRNHSLIVDPPGSSPVNGSHSFVVVPVRDDDNVVIAALAAMEFDSIGYAEIAGFGPDGDRTSVCVVDPSGRITASNQHQGISDETPLYLHKPDSERELTPVAAAALSNFSTQEGPSQGVLLEPYINHNGDRVVGAWQWVPNSSSGVFLEQEADVANWPLQLIFNAILLGLVGFVGSLFWAPTRQALARRQDHQQVLLDSRYRVEGLVGEGGLSHVYRAWDEALDRQVAVKMLKTEHTGGISASRFRREVHLLGRLNHPTTIQVFDAGILSSGVPYYVMEFLDGITLEGIVSQHGAFPQRRAIQIATEVCASLSEAHAAGVIHRDVKPQNVMISHLDTEQEYLKVLDFGLGKDFLAQPVEQMTATAEITGTVQFMAPECISDPDNIGPPADVYSVGALLYYLLTARRLYHGQSMLAAIHSIVHEQPDLTALRQLPVAAELFTLVSACLSKQPSGRPASATQLRHQLLELPVTG